MSLEFRTKTSVSDTGGSVAYVLDQHPVLSASGTLLMSIRNDGTEKFKLDHSGQLWLGGTPGGYTPASNAGLVVNTTLLQLGDGSGNIGLDLKSGSAGAYISDGSLFWLGLHKTAGAGRNQVFSYQPLTFDVNQGIIYGSQANGGAGAGAPSLKLATLNTLSTSGDRLLSLVNSNEKFYIEYDGTVYPGAANNSAIYKSREDSGATAIAHIFDTVNSISTAGSRLLSVRNNGSEKMLLDDGGNILSTNNYFMKSISVFPQSSGYKMAQIQLIQGSPGVELESYDDNTGNDANLQLYATASPSFFVYTDKGSSDYAQIFAQTSDGGAHGGAGGKALRAEMTVEVTGNWFPFIGLSSDGYFCGGSGPAINDVREWDFLSICRDAADSTAYWMDTHRVLTSPTARLLSVFNQGNEKFSIGINGGVHVRRTSTASSVNSAGEVIIGVTDTSSARTITLDSDDVVAGRIMIIKDESGGAGTNNITVDTEGSELIDGAASVTITANYGVLRVYSDGTNWFSW